MWYHRYMEEVWKDVVGYEGRYEVSSFGRLRGPRGITEGSIGSRGYSQVCLRIPGEKYGVSKNLHVLVAESFFGPRPKNMHVCHTDGNKQNNRVENLRYDTAKNNWEDFRRNPTRSNHSITRTSCPQGHPLEHPNLMKSQLARGWRSCLACSRARSYIRANQNKKIVLKELADKYYEGALGER
jgi:hypothetical protein